MLACTFLSPVTCRGAHLRITLLENARAVFFAPFYATAALDHYDAEGLDVETRMSPAAATTLHSVASGEADVSWGGPLWLMQALDRNPRGGYVAFCEVVGRDPFYLVGRTPIAHFRFEDLLGRNVATVSEVPTPWICLQHDLRRAGIDPAVIVRAPARTMSENAAALRAGEVDVIQVFQPLASTLVDEGAGHIWYAAARRGPLSLTTFNTTRSFLERNPDAALRLTRAMYRTQQWIQAHSGRDLAEVIARYLPNVPVPLLAACCDDYKALGLWNQQPVPQREGFEWLRDALMASGSISTRFAYEQCMDSRFAEQVVSEAAASAAARREAARSTHT